MSEQHVDGPTQSGFDLLSEGSDHFTVREQQILHGCATGLSDRQIAMALDISLSTVRRHMERLFNRHRVHSRAAAVAIWIAGRYGLPIPDVYRPRL